jgi:hypothetical protein
MKPLLRKIFFWDAPARGAFFGLTLLMLCILLLTGCVSEYAHIESAILKPTLVPNIYCEAGKHEMPRFTAEQVLLVSPLHIVKKVDSGENAIEYVETDLLFPDGERTVYINDHLRKLKQLWKSGCFQIIVYDGGSEEQYDPFLYESNAYYLRAYAMEHGIPIAILYGTDSDASVLPGIPQGIRQYWQCPTCAKLYSEQQKEALKFKWNTANMLLFPLNVVPDMLVGICYYTGAFVYSIFTSDEFGWYVIGLPIAAYWGAFDGMTNALEGRPFWNMKLMDGGSRVHKD